MLRLIRVLVCLVAVAMMVNAARAQTPAVDSGWYELSSAGIGNDSGAGWSARVDSAVGYNFSNNFASEIGLPFYLVTTTSATTSGTTTSTTRSNAVGDLFVRMRYGKQSEVVNYTTMVTATAPTGDTSAGVSTGRATFTWGNRFERSFSRLTPFGEASIGNTLASSHRYRRSYATLGAASEFRGGIGFELIDGVSLEGSAYGDVGFGNQKVYSQTVAKGLTGTQGNPKHPRPFQANYVTAGTGSLVNDHGLTADLSLSPAPRFMVDVAYNRSVAFALNTVSITVGVRLGHMPKAAGN